VTAAENYKGYEGDELSQAGGITNQMQHGMSMRDATITYICKRLGICLLKRCRYRSLENQTPRVCLVVLSS
jgi:hypothetical protein